MPKRATSAVARSAVPSVAQRAAFFQGQAARAPDVELAEVQSLAPQPRPFEAAADVAGSKVPRVRAAQENSD